VTPIPTSRSRPESVAIQVMIPALDHASRTSPIGPLRAFALLTALEIDG
jgi:hypothetical protein